MKKHEINLIYFSAIFLLIFGINYCDLSLTTLPFKKLLTVEILIQSLFITSIFIALSVLAERYLSKKSVQMVIVLSGFTVLGYDVDLILRRCLGPSIFQSIRFCFARSSNNFLELLKATSVPLTTWILGACGVFILAWLWILLFHITNRFKKLKVTKKQIVLCLALQLISLPILNSYIVPSLSYEQYEKYRTSLPLRNTWETPTKFTVLFHGLKNRDIITSNPRYISKKPPIFLFILESVGEKYINPTATPNLAKFRDENISFDTATSGGNATMLSWYSIFHSQYSLRWSQKNANEMAKHGSLSLKELKDLGYQIHLYSSADLAFYKMKDSLFGKNAALTNSFFSPPPELETHAKDALVMNQLRRDLPKYSGDGHVFIVFLDSTHFCYSWPESHNYFYPFDERINLLTATHSFSDRNKIFNRYQNSIYYVDTLMGEFFAAPKSKDSIIVITGDHGEEFYDQGNLFHASNLSKEQIQVPLYFQFGKKTKELKAKASPICSHTDIFPTLLGYLGQEELPSSDGESIFKTNRHSYTVTARSNGGLFPYEYCIQTTQYKMTFRFSNSYGWPYSDECYLLSFRTNNDELIPDENIQKEFFKEINNSN